MKLTIVKNNNTKAHFSGKKEDIAHIAKTLFASEQKNTSTKKSKTKIKKIDPTTIEVDGILLSLRKKERGTDYCVYEKNTEYFISKEKNLKDSKKIGGFHYGLIPEDFKAQNNIDKKHARKIAGINAYSIWDNNHRPACEPYGMVYVKKANIWVDIYLCNSNYKNVGTSFSKGAILAGDNYEGRELPDDFDSFTYLDFVNVALRFGKRMLTKDEFQIAMDGVKENVSAEDLDNGRIQHIDFLTSKFGIEQATGVQWIWGTDKHENYDKTTVVLGGYRAAGAIAGSRCSGWNFSVSYSVWSFGARFASDHLSPAK